MPKRRKLSRKEWKERRASKSIKIGSVSEKQPRINVSRFNDYFPPQPERSGEFRRVNVTSEDLLPPDSMLPDYGEHYYELYGETPTTMELEEPYIIEGPLETHIGFVVDDKYLGTIITNQARCRAYRNNPGPLTIKPCPEKAYTVPSGVERVLPFVIVD